MASTIEPEANLINVAVEKPLQNLGIGKQALELLVDKLKKSKVNTLHLEVRQHSPAVRFYLRQGFVPTGQRKAYYADGENAILMTKSI
jgi:ribosomal-protein-alanine N-acetyltransferase